MKSILMLLLALLYVVPGWSAGKKKKKTYVAKTKKSVKYSKKRKGVYIRKYPVRSNTPRSGEELKLRELVKDIYE